MVPYIFIFCYLNGTIMAILNVYHFYRDLLYNFANYIDNLCGNVFRKIELNIQTRTYLYKDFDSSLKLPALMLQCSSLLNRLEFNNPLLTYGINEVHSIPLLYNETRNQYIIANCQYNQVSIELIINAATQLEVLELAQYINQQLPQNITFEWNFSSFIPLIDELLVGWDLDTDNIYYLYESKLTEKINDRIIDKQVYYALFTMNSLVTASSQSAYPNDFANTQTANLSFIVNTFVPTTVYRNDIPDRLHKVVYGFGTGTEPISTISHDLINDITETTDYVFYKGVVINNSNLTFDSDNNEFVLEIDNLNTDPAGLIFVIFFDYIRANYVSTIDNKIQLTNYEDNKATYRISKSVLTDYQSNLFMKVINNELQLEGTYFKKKGS